MIQYNELFDKINPDTSDDTFTAEVLKKHQRRKNTNKRTIIFTICVISVLMISTLTAGAVNNWDYPEIVRSIFGSNSIDYTPFRGDPEVLLTDHAGGHEDINFTIGINTFDGITFDVTGLYAEANALIIFIDVISDVPVFSIGNESTYNTRNPDTENDAFLFNNTTGQWDAEHTRFSKIYVQNENTVTVIYRISDLSDSVSEGTEFTMMFYGITEMIGLINNEPVLESKLGSGEAEIMFAINNLALENIISIHPDVLLESGNVIKEMRISPFCIWIKFDGNEEGLEKEFSHIRTIQLKMNDGSTATTSSNASTGKFDANTNIFEIMYYISFDNLLNVKDIEAVVYRDVEIALTTNP